MCQDFTESRIHLHEQTGLREGWKNLHMMVYDALGKTADVAWEAAKDNNNMRERGRSGKIQKTATDKREAGPLLGGPAYTSHLPGLAPNLEKSD